MKRLAILGASGHGKVVAEIAQLEGFDEIVFFDDAFPKVKMNGVWKILGNTDALVSKVAEFSGCIVAIGENSTRLAKTVLLINKKAVLVTLVHPSAVISSYSQIGAGSVVMANAVINPFVTLGKSCIVNTASTIDHDCVIGDGVHVSPGVNIAGSVTVGHRSWLGIGSSVRQCITVGNDTCIGAGAVVISNIGDNVTVVGLPAKEINGNG